MKRLRLLLAAAAAVAVALGALWYTLRPAAYPVVAPVRGDAAEIVYATGVVEPRTWAKVSSLTRDRIVEMCDCEGEQVAGGAALARLDDTEEQATLAELRARKELADTDLQRLLRLLERDIAAIQDVDRARSEADQLSALIAGQESRIDSLVLRSPTAGIVLRQDGEVGEIAEPGAVLFWVGRPRPLIVVAEVNEEDIPRVAPGQRTLLRADAFPARSLEATVDSITPMGDPTTKTYRVRLALPADTPLRIGMTVEINIVVNVSEDALLVPVTALSGDTLYLVGPDGRARRRDIEVGIRGEVNAEVLSGIAPEDLVILSYPEGLREEQRVRAERN